MKFLQFLKMAFCSFFILGVLVSCKNDKNVIADEEEIITSDTPVSGKISMLVEESVLPIVEDVVNVFQYEYSKVNITLKKSTEYDIILSLLNDSCRVAVLPRRLTEDEVSFLSKRVKPKETEFATDAIVFVTNKQFKDSILDLNKIVSNLKNETKDVSHDHFLVFDHYASNISSEFRKMVDSTAFSKDYAYYMKDTNEVIEYVESNPRAIGIVGLNWLSQSDSVVTKLKDNLKVLSVKNSTDNQYYKPTQNNIGEGTYELVRKLYVIDLQGKTGLGTGFASYLAGPKGQRIVLKSGLLPTRVPPREILVRKTL